MSERFSPQIAFLSTCPRSCIQSNLVQFLSDFAVASDDETNHCYICTALHNQCCCQLSPYIVDRFAYLKESGKVFVRIPGVVLGTLGSSSPQLVSNFLSSACTCPTLEIILTILNWDPAGDKSDLPWDCIFMR